MKGEGFFSSSIMDKTAADDSACFRLLKLVIGSSSKLKLVSFLNKWVRAVMVENCV